MGRPIDKTKKANVKCEHCDYFQCTNRSVKPYDFEPYECTNSNSPKYKKIVNYWNRCKGFKWKE